MAVRSPHLVLSAWILLTAATFGQSPPPSSGPPARHAIPTAAARASALKQITGSYGTTWSDAKNVEQKADLAKRLHGDGLTEVDLVVRYVLLDQAKQFGAQAGDDAIAMAALERLLAEYNLGLGADHSRLQLCQQLCKDHMNGHLQQRILARLIALTDERIAADDYPLAHKYADEAAKVSAGLPEKLAATLDQKAQLKLRIGKALSASQGNREPEVVDHANALARLVGSLETAYVAAKAASSILQKNPRQSHANLRKGQFDCFRKNRWSTGLRHLAEGADAKLKKLAQEELANPTTLTARLELAHGWWDAAASLPTQEEIQRSAIRLHAARWYRLVLDDLSGIAARDVQTRLDLVDNDTNAALVPPGDGITVRTCLLREQRFKCKEDLSRVLKYHFVVPALVDGKGTLEIKVTNMGDDTGDCGMHCELRDAAGGQVFRRFGMTTKTFPHEVAGNTTWTLILEDHDTRGDGNGGTVEVWLAPK